MYVHIYIHMYKYVHTHITQTYTYLSERLNKILTLTLEALLYSATVPIKKTVQCYRTHQEKRHTFVRVPK